MAFRAALMESRFQKRLSAIEEQEPSVHQVFLQVCANRCASLGIPLRSIPTSSELAQAARETRVYAAQVKAECRQMRASCARQRSAVRAAVESSRIALETARSRMDAGRVVSLSFASSR